MVFTKEETIEVENLKFKQKIEFEDLRHEHRMKELSVELEIAKNNSKASIESEEE